MEVIVTPGASRLQLRLLLGQNEQGNNVYRLRSFGNVRDDADNEDLLVMAAALADLQVHTLAEILRHDSATLTQA